jgi:Trk K+ transport system NAD-binding subunit
VDVLELSGATTVLPLKRQLGESLANRVDTGRAEAHVIGSFGTVRIAELPARDTLLAGIRVRDTRLRERTGLSVVGLWERGKLRPAFPDTEIRQEAVVVVAGTADQIRTLDRLIARDGTTTPVLVIGAGKVGEAAARALKQKGLTVYAIDRDERPLAALARVADDVYVGDAADRELIERAGIGRVASVLLTTNDDAMNIYLAVYCRKLNPALRIISRITHERNVEAIHRAGADFVLSYASLGVDSLMALISGGASVMLGEGVRLFEVPVPSSLADKPLSASGIGSHTGLSVVALDVSGTLTTQLTADTILPDRATLLMLGSAAQRQQFAEQFERNGR